MLNSYVSNDIRQLPFQPYVTRVEIKGCAEETEHEHVQYEVTTTFNPHQTGDVS